METFIAIMSIIWTVLCLVFFFKVWGMTNDVKEIKKHLISVIPLHSKEIVEEINKPKSELSTEINVNDIVKSKYSGREVKVIEVLENGKYRCLDLYKENTYETLSLNEIII